MSDLINRDALPDEILESRDSYVGDPISVQQHKLMCDNAFSWVEGAPAVDAVPVVRCEDCIFWHTRRCAMRQRTLYPAFDFYCGYGKRRR